LWSWSPPPRRGGWFFYLQDDPLPLPWADAPPPKPAGRGAEAGCRAPSRPPVGGARRAPKRRSRRPRRPAAPVDELDGKIKASQAPRPADLEKTGRRPAKAGPKRRNKQIADLEKKGPADPVYPIRIPFACTVAGPAIHRGIPT